MAQKRILGVIGGSGLYALDALDDPQTVDQDTPWGRPSAPVVRGRLGDLELLFLSRHGAGHATPPDAINYRANIDALKRLGATDLLSVSACGSLREDRPPGSFVIVDQYIDRTHGRPSSFFGPGFVAHVSMARPVCPVLAQAAHEACAAVGVSVAMGGTYLCMNGPQFSSYAESMLYRQWGADVIGMTNMPEAKLAREAELPYASVAMVTDYDCWHEDEADVDVASLLETMRANTGAARKMLVALAGVLGPTRVGCPSGIETCLDSAVITAPDARDAALLAKLDAVAGRFLATGR
ncbi:MAG: S-methyl-5'-thioadenosine phosphorylase [Pseudomonadota bacterium]